MWAYAGSSRRYFDYGVNGKIVIGPTERALHHYGSGINSVVLLGGYERFPNDTYALRTGFAATWGSLTTIDIETGAPHMGFHGDASQLIFEPYTADYGVNAYGSSVGWGCMVDNDVDLGAWVGYGCDVFSASPTSTVHTLVPYDPHHRRVYLGPLGLRIFLRTAAIANVTVDTAARTLTVVFDHSFVGAGLYSAVRVVVDVPANPAWATVANVTVTSPSPAPPVVRGAYELPANAASLTLSWLPAA
jgi:hypothetical protein